MEHPTRVGKYDIEQFLGGGMSRVYRAKDSVLGRVVALKILAEAAAADAESKARFLQEARTASNITHESIISVYDFGEDQGRPFMVMEFLEGESLRAAIKQGRTGDVRGRLRIALQIGRAVDYIHTRRIVHRDIKPENIHVDPTGRAKLMDFGIAKSEGVHLTRTGFTLGTPYYMAPEQVLGAALTAQADVYSFGILLFELLTEARPVTGTSVENIFHKILHDPLNLEPLRRLDLPPELAALVERCTAKKPIDRPKGLGPVCREIEKILKTVTGGGARLALLRRPTERQPDEVSEILTPTITAMTASPPGPAATPGLLDGFPEFVQKLPPPLRTQGGLMLMAGVIVVMGVTVLYWVLTLARIF